MARFAVIGLGKFGAHVARALFDAGHEVMGIDTHNTVVQDLRDQITQAVVADCSDVDNLRALDVASCDAVIVSMGERMDASILVTLYLKELGCKRIVVKAVSDDHGKVLRLVGASEVVHPERSTALRLASSLGAKNIVEYLPIGVGFSLVEIGAPKVFQGRTLGELQLRARHNVLVVAVKNGDRLDLVPGAPYEVKEGDILVVIGRDVDLTALTRAHD
jgi:trk system potassium uptake protein TrkA